MKRLTLVISLIILLVVFQGCHIGTAGSWKNGNIDPGVKNDIHSLNTRLLQNIKADNVAGVKQLMSQTLLDSAGSKIDTLVNSLSKSFSTAAFNVMDEYYTKATTSKITNSLFSTNDDDNDYQLQYVLESEESYTSLLTSPNSSSGGIMLVVYGKYGGDWKINIFYIGDYKALGKTAPDFYKLAVGEYSKGNMINAADNIIMAKELARPLQAYFKYKIEDKMKDFYSKVIKEANTQYKFPVTLNQIGSAPQIFGINPQVVSKGTDTGVFPIVTYKSAIALSDTIALKKENNAMQKIMSGIFKGIDQNKAIIYLAYDTIPDGKTLVKRYGFIQHLK